MRRTILLSLTTLLATLPAHAGTFESSRIAPDLGLDALTRAVAREQVGRDLFGSPYATVTIGTVDLYNVFPYVESRTFQVVSDPRWNRLVFGEAGRSLGAFDGAGTPLGRLSDPRGMAVDAFHRLYVADAGNDRIVVLQASTEFGDMRLVPLHAIGGLHRPQAVAWSDGGTPFVADDDVLYVADTGANRIVAFALRSNGARELAAMGELGSGPGRFAGPLAIAAGRAGTGDLYVADAHTRRLVHLRLAGGAFEWVSEVRHDADVVTSLDTDRWGNVYAAAPNRGVVRKYGPSLEPVAELAGLDRPKGFHLPFVNVHDHRADRVERVGRPNGVSVDRWSDAGGVRLWSLGLEVAGFAIEPGEAPAARFTLTDAAEVTLEVADRATGRTVARRPIGTLDAGTHALVVTDDDLRAAAAAAEPVVRVAAASRYADGPTAFAQAPIAAPGGPVVGRPSQPVLLGHSPNPVAPSTRISFVMPDGWSQGGALRIFDTMGRQVRAFEQPFAPGLNEVAWDGTDARGRAVPAGVYYYRLKTGAREQSRTMVVVR